MRNLTKFCSLAAMVALVAAPAAFGAPLDPLLTFGFTDLDGDFTTGGDGGTFTAVATAESLGGPFNSAGDVTRVVEPGDTANFDAGFVASSMADFQLEMSISDITDSFATAVGTFTITDEDGDTITGQLSGSWELIAGGEFGTVFGSFEGLIESLQLNNISGDGTFDGPGGGSFGMDLPGGPMYQGAVIVLETGGWFTEDFQDIDAQIEASIVPVPGGALLGLIGLGIIGRIRRG